MPKTKQTKRQEAEIRMVRASLDHALLRREFQRAEALTAQLREELGSDEEFVRLIAGWKSIERYLKSGVHRLQIPL